MFRFLIYRYVFIILGLLQIITSQIIKKVTTIQIEEKP